MTPVDTAGPGAAVGVLPALPLQGGRGEASAPDEGMLLAALLEPTVEDVDVDGGGDQLLELLCTRRLDHSPFGNVYLDATYVKSRCRGQIRFEAIVAATGIRTDGGVEVLGMDVGDSEDSRFWVRFLTQLKARGLGGVEIVGSDEHGGLREALTTVYPQSRWEWSPGTGEPVRPRRSLVGSGAGTRSHSSSRSVSRWTGDPSGEPVAAGRCGATGRRGPT